MRLASYSVKGVFPKEKVVEMVPNDVPVVVVIVKRQGTPNDERDVEI